MVNCVKHEHADRNNEPSVTGLDEFIPETNFDDNTDDSNKRTFRNTIKYKN